MTFNKKMGACDYFELFQVLALGSTPIFKEGKKEMNAWNANI